MLFMNFSSDSGDAFKSKYREVAEKYKGEGLSFLVGDLEASQGAFQVMFCFIHLAFMFVYTAQMHI